MEKRYAGAVLETVILIPISNTFLCAKPEKSTKKQKAVKTAKLDEQNDGTDWKVWEFVA